MASETFAQALRRQGGMWASAWRDGRMLTDVVQVTATMASQRVQIPLVGQTTFGYKPGRFTAEGSVVFQKVDTGWELDVLNALTLDVEELRAQRDAGNFSSLGGTFDMQVKSDDPHAFGKEVWTLTGCQLWQLEVGFNIADDFTSRTIPLTFDKATPVETFRVVDGVVQRVNTISG